jgi:glycosyltransferase involved in cell wall biosynthesis
VEIGREADRTFFQHQDSETLRQYLDLGVRSIGYWRLGVDPEIFHPRVVDQRYDLAFMANNPPVSSPEKIPGAGERLEFVKAIARLGPELHIFGEGWESLKALGNVHLHPFVSGRAFSEACSAARITLGFGTDRFLLYTSWPRPLRSMASGAFHLTRYFPGLETVFTNRGHLAWFNGIAEAVELIEHYLEHDDERERIAAAGRREVLRRHTWDGRIDEMLALLRPASDAQLPLAAHGRTS